MKITIDDKFMSWILDRVKSDYCNEYYRESGECIECPYYYMNRKHVHGFADCTKIPLLEALMIDRKLYEQEHK